MEKPQRMVSATNKHNPAIPDKWEIRFPELPQHDAQNVHFSTENYKTYKEIEKYIPSTENRV